MTSMSFVLKALVLCIVCGVCVWVWAIRISVRACVCVRGAVGFVFVWFASVPIAVSIYDLYVWYDSVRRELCNI